MKKMVTRILVFCMVMALAVALAGCGGEKNASSEGTEKPLKIGVIQYAPHPSLDNCYTGFVQGLAQAGYVDGENITIDFQNAMGEMQNSDLIAKNMVTGGYDLIMAIATPAAMSAYSAAKDTAIPVIFSAVSDPLKAGLVESLEKPNTSCTGTSDTLNLEGQLKMIRAFLPAADTIGILYTTSEPNSVSQLEKIQGLAPDYGFSIEAVGINNASEVATGAATLVAKGVDCVNNFTDNNVVDNLSVLLHAADAAGIPVFGSEITQVENGCVASESLDYVALGVQTGLMAAKVMSGEATVGELPVQLIADSVPVYSAANCAKFNITLPSAYADATNVDK